MIAIKTFILLFICFTFSSCAKKEIDINLTGTAWEIISIKQFAQLMPYYAKEIYTLEFTNDTTYTLFLDVNKCIGAYTLHTGWKIVLEESACTKVCCDTKYADALKELMPDMTEYYISSDTLKLSGNGQIILKKL